jgi:hypothetical protein
MFIQSSLQLPAAAQTIGAASIARRGGSAVPGMLAALYRRVCRTGGYHEAR